VFFYNENIGITTVVGPGANSIEENMIMFIKTKLSSIQDKNKGVLIT
jgi:hypothetical protein